jgi:surface protein
MKLIVILSGIIGCQAVFTPNNRDELKAAVGTCTKSGSDPNYVYTCTGGCLGEDATGGCPNFAASLDATGNPYGQISDWDVLAVESLYKMFYYATQFNQDISDWGVSSSVTTLQFAFTFAAAFNSDLSGWDVSNVMNLQSTFYGATVFNSDLSKWDVSSVTNVMAMFQNAIAFNYDLSSWDTSSVTTLRATFKGATAFESDLSKWDISSAIEMSQWVDQTGFAMDGMAQCTMDLEQSGRFQGCSLGGGPYSMICKRGFDMPTPGWEGVADDRYYQPPWHNVQSFTCTCDAGSKKNIDWATAPNVPFDPDVSPCIICPVGTYQDQADQLSCNDCPFGKYQNAEGQISCEICPVGTYQNETNSESCKTCPLGTYQNVAGQSSCETCPSGQSTLSPRSTTNDCFTATQIRDKFVSSPEPDLVPAYNIANSCA